MTLEEKIVTKKRFSEAVEALVRSKNMPWIDAVIAICEEKMIEPAEANRLLNESIKMKIEAEAMKLNLLPKGNELPFD